MLNYYAIEIEYGKEAGWTFCEARHPREAQQILQRRLGRDFVVRQIRPAQPPIIVTEAKDTKMQQETEPKTERRLKAPKQPRTKAVVTPDAEYPSIKEAQKHIVGGVRKLRQLFREQPDKYYIK